MSEVLVRQPLPSDANAIAALLGALGYPAEPNDIPARLATLALDARNSATWLAELDGEVIGLAGGRVFHALHQAEPVAHLTILVVDERARGRGVGQHLVRIAEEWAKARGAWRISLTSALHRVEAHRFYERIGYQHTGVRLAKTL